MGTAFPGQREWYEQGGEQEAGIAISFPSHHVTLLQPQQNVDATGSLKCWDRRPTGMALLLRDGLGITQTEADILPY